MEKPWLLPGACWVYGETRRRTIETLKHSNENRYTICKLYIQTRTKIVQKNISQGYHDLWLKQNEHLRKIYFRFGAELAKTKQLMPELHLLIVLFGTSLVTNIRTKASKKHQIKCPISHFWVQLKFRFKTHFRNSVWHF